MLAGDAIGLDGAREIFDDTGTFPGGGWLTQFCQGMIDRQYAGQILFSCNMRFGGLGPDHPALMKRAGFRKLKMGLESANQATLDRLNNTLDKVNSGQGTIGQLMVNPALYENLVGTSTEVRELMKAFRANPKKFLSIKLHIF